MTRHVAAAISLLAGIVFFGTAPSAQDLSPVRGWEAPEGGVLSIVNATKRHAAATITATTTSSNPIVTLLNETQKAVSGKNKYVKETAAIAFGKGNTTTLSTSLKIDTGKVPTDMTCVIDPQTGSLIGLKIGMLNLGSKSGYKVSVPTSTGYISQIKAAYSYDGEAIDRLIFEVKTTPNAPAQRIACGTAGGKAFDLLPKNYVVTGLWTNFATSAALQGRKLSQSGCVGITLNIPGLCINLASRDFQVYAAPVSLLKPELAMLRAAGVKPYSECSDPFSVEDYPCSLVYPVQYLQPDSCSPNACAFGCCMGCCAGCSCFAS